METVYFTPACLEWSSSNNRQRARSLLNRYVCSQLTSSESNLYIILGLRHVHVGWTVMCDTCQAAWFQARWVILDEFSSQEWTSKTCSDGFKWLSVKSNTTERNIQLRGLYLPDKFRPLTSLHLSSSVGLQQFVTDIWTMKMSFQLVQLQWKFNSKKWQHVEAVFRYGILFHKW
jgi:hypothetical protein